MTEEVGAIPYDIVMQDSEHCVVKQDTGQVVPGGCHATAEEAQAHIAALEIATEGETANAIAWEGPIAYEGQETGDGRAIEPGAIVWDDAEAPWPVKWVRSSGDGHEGGIVVGRMDAIERRGAEIWGRGVLLSAVPEVAELAMLIREGAAGGVSIDIDDVEDNWEEIEGEEPVVATRLRIRGVTLVDTPAFNRATIALLAAAFARRRLSQATTVHVLQPAIWDVNALECNECLATVEGAPSYPHLLPEDSASLVTDGSIETVNFHHDLVKTVVATCLPENANSDVPPVGRLDEINRSEKHLNVNEQIPNAMRNISNTRKTIVETVPTNGVTDTRNSTDSRQKPHWTSSLHKETSVPSVAQTLSTPKDEEPIRTRTSITITRPVKSESGSVHHVTGPSAVSKTIPTLCEQHSLTSDGMHTLIRPPKTWFENPQLMGPTALTVEENGRVFGHCATWHTCHTGKGGCVTVPRSASGYRHFLVGAVHTAEGTTVPVGHLTVATGHAGLQRTAAAARDHYDHTGAAVADVAVGEDAWGVWVAGAVRPGATPEQVYTLRASALSGDWRAVDGNLELVALLAVNVPGFPVPRAALAASGEIEALIVSWGTQEWETLMERIARLERMAAHLRPVTAAAIRDRIVAGRG